jgi:hypothetical protein
LTRARLLWGIGVLVTMTLIAASTGHSYFTVAVAAAAILTGSLGAHAWGQV